MNNNRRARDPSSKILTSLSAAVTSEKLRENGRKLVLCHGVFDLLHPGHVAHLSQARELGDKLFVSVTPDRYVDKGPGRPVYSAQTRMAMLASLEVVDFVFESESATATSSIKTVLPNLYVKGPDYSDLKSDITGEILREKSAVETLGGKLAFTSGETMSSSALINELGLARSKSSNLWITGQKPSLTANEAHQFLDAISSVKVIVVGETILDRYVKAEALGKTSKEPVLAFLPTSMEEHLGGAAAIARHCAGLGANVTLITRLGMDSEGEKVRQDLENLGIEVIAQESSAQATIVKTRFLDESSGAKVFETYQMTDSPPPAAESARFAQMVAESASSAQLALVADYGHGLMSEDVIAAVSQSQVRIAVNTQSNAGNRGFNSISRYKGAEIVCLNGGELTLELRKRHVSVPELLPELGAALEPTWLVVTEGSRGVALWHKVKGVTEVPAFAQKIVDRVGAGDALFATTSILLFLGAPPNVAGMVGNLAGASVIAELGNKAAVSLISLKRHVTALLK